MFSPEETANAAKPRFKVTTFLWYWLPVLIWMSVVFSASSDSKSYQHSMAIFEPLLRWLFPWMSPQTVELCHHLFRKLGHLTEYAVLALLFYRAIRKSAPGDLRPWRWSEAGLALMLVFAYAASDEFHQVFVPTRTPLVSDVLIDTTGGAAALLMLWAGQKLFSRSRLRGAKV